MATMISEVYEALIDAGADKSKAKAAAEALSAEQLATKKDILELEKVTKSEVARIEKELAVIKWMLGLVIVAVIIPIVRDLF